MIQTCATENYSLRWGSATDAGNSRAENEDSLLASAPVFLVADGMGGHQLGKEASSHVVDAFQPLTGLEWLSLEDIDSAILRAVELVGALSEATHAAPGSTVTGLGLVHHEGVPCWVVFNVGDSRTYRLRGSRLEQVTVDHSEAQELLDQGMNATEVHTLGVGHVITRAIGGGARGVPVVDQWLLPAHPGDRMLLCSDGLTDELPHEQIAAILQSPLEADDAARALVEGALTAGGRDNVTAVVVDAHGLEGGSPAPYLDDVTQPDLTVFTTEDATVPDLPRMAAEADSSRGEE
jgi:serine/threonine protein phosphatase PrpC